MNWPKPRFRCAHPGCGASYVRKEHLVRHAEQHDQNRAFLCPDCGMSFSRSDSLRRHAKLHTGPHSKKSRDDLPDRVTRACDLCHSTKSKCDRDNPCALCARKGLQCTFDRFNKEKLAATRSSSVMSENGKETPSPRKRRRVETPDLSPQDFAAPATAGDEEEHNMRITLRQHETQIQHDLMKVSDQQHLEQQQQPQHRQNPPVLSLRLSSLFKMSYDFIVDAKSHGVDNADVDEDMDTYMNSIDVQYYVDLFFLYVHPKWPFLFRSAFKTESEPPILVLAVVMFGLWVTEEARLMKLAWMIHARLRVIFETQMGNWAVETSNTRTTRWPIVTYQSILLFTIFAMTAHGSTEIFDKDENDCDGDMLDHVYSIFTHLARTCRAQGVLYYPAMLAQTSVDDPITFKFCSLEELKYFALTLYKVDHLLSHLMEPDTASRTQADEAPKEQNNNNTRLVISDLQFPLPDSGYLFEASSMHEFLRRRERQSRDPSALSARQGAIVADDRKTMFDREKNPWICDVLQAGSSTSSLASTKAEQYRKRRKAWMSLGHWLGFLGGLDPVVYH